MLVARCKPQNLVLHIGLLFHLQSSKDTLKIPPFKTEATHGNGNGNGDNSSFGIESRGYSRRLRKRNPLKGSLVNGSIWAEFSMYASLLQECVNKKALPEGKQVHAHMILVGFNPDIYLGTKLLIMYAKCGSLADARRAFNEMPKRDVVAWTVMIAAYARFGADVEALALFSHMDRTGVQPNQFTFASVLPACANVADLQRGRKAHEDIIRGGFQSDVFVGSALVDMYAKCGCIEGARQVFDKMPERNVVTWNAMIGGYAQNGRVDAALKLFQKMPEWNVVSWTSMIAGYAQNGYVDEALMFFQKMPERDSFSWNAMIAGYAQNSYFNEALDLFRQMRLSALKPDSVTFICVLPVCASLGTLRNGKEVHENIIRGGFQADVFLGSALVDMYAKCGSLENAAHVFDKIPERDEVLWNAMIIGYAMHGCGKEAIQLFEQMQHSGMKPNSVTFVGVLSACCHAGLVDAGWRYFDGMSRDHDITPAIEHYCCMVDLLGRAGCLEKALEFVGEMPIKPDAAVWGCLLGAYRSQANIELGKRVAEHLFELEPKNAANYVLLSNIYAAAGRWDDVEKVRKLMNDRSIKKTPGCSWIEVGNKVYSFFARDKSHLQAQEI